MTQNTEHDQVAAKTESGGSDSRRLLAGAWPKWKLIENGLPPRCNHEYYGDRYSIPVLLGSIVTEYVHRHGWRWDYDLRGWVDANLRDGADPEYYDDPGASSWAEWPTISPC